ncbi:MAG: hypothetical protein QOH36_207 [Actinomycetota bacterium]|nr:hypothetical protein [Actinomycetota bacterium]
MGLCHDFGSQIAEGCGHPMRAGLASCTCDVCGVVCEGRFEGCAEVWARGPHPILLRAAPPADDLLPALGGPRTVNGHQPPADAPAALDPIRPAIEAGAAVAREREPQVVPAPAGDPAPSPVPADGLRWVEGAFDTLRQEVEGLRSALAKEQALVATLVGTEKPEAGPDVESLLTAIDMAVRKAVRRESVALSDTVTAVVEGLRRDMEAARTASEATLATLQQTLDEVAAATASVPAELGRHDAGTRKAFKTALGQELQPVIEAVAESIAQSDYELKAISGKLDALAVSDAELGAAIADLSAVVEALADEAGVEFDESEAEPPPPPRPPLGRRAADPPTTSRRVSLRGSRP